jgi:hypothetical protein
MLLRYCYSRGMQTATVLDLQARRDRLAAAERRAALIALLRQAKAANASGQRAAVDQRLNSALRAMGAA